MAFSALLFAQLFADVEPGSVDPTSEERSAHTLRGYDLACVQSMETCWCVHRVLDALAPNLAVSDLLSTHRQLQLSPTYLIAAEASSKRKTTLTADLDEGDH